MKSFKEFIFRLFLFFVFILVSWFTSPIFLHFFEKYIGYRIQNSYFSFIDDAIIAIGAALVFFSGVFFGALGKKWDYAVIILFIAFSVYGYYGTENVTPLMFAGLGIAALLGNAIGFGLKFLRQKYLPKFDI